MDGRGLQAIRVDDARVVLKRGMRELLISGESICALAEHVVPRLDGVSREQLLEAFPSAWHAGVEHLLAMLLERGLIGEEEGGGGPATAQEAFFADFGSGGAQAPARLAAAHVAVLGVNLVTQALVRGLRGSGVGRVTLVSHPQLDGTSAPTDAAASASNGGGEEPLDEIDLVCAGSDLGLGEALLQSNRDALAARRPFLPCWMSELVGHVGPLVHPFQTPCLRCYSLRVDSNDALADVTNAVRRHVTGSAGAGPPPRLLAPMAHVVGDVAAMEAIKLLGRFVPSDTVGRAIELDLVSFASRSRRVLRLPRCPDCSRVMDAPGLTVRVGPAVTAVGMQRA